MVPQGGPQGVPIANGLYAARRRLGEGDGLAGRVPGLDVEGDRGGVDGGLDALVVDAGDALLDAAAFVVHKSLQKGGSAYLR